MLVAPCPVLASLYLKKCLGFSWPWCAVTPSAPLGTNTQPSSRSAFVFEPSLLGRFSPFISVLLWWLAVLWSPLQHVEALSPKCRQSGGWICFVSPQLGNWLMWTFGLQNRGEGSKAFIKTNGPFWENTPSSDMFVFVPMYAYAFTAPQCHN